MPYYELWTILGSWKSEFSSEDFASVFPSPNPRKVLSDMSIMGFLKREGRGRYKVVEATNFAKSKTNVDEAYNLLKRSRLPYALTDVDSVFVWTNGGYNANRFFGSYPIYLRVPRSNLDDWRNYLESNGKECTLRGERPKKTLYGTYYLLSPEEKIESTSINSLNVDSLEKTVDFCLAESYTYEPALEMLDKAYNLGLGTRYADAEIIV